MKMANPSNVAICFIVLLCCVLQFAGFFTRKWVYNDICPESNTFYMRCRRDGTFIGIYTTHSLYWVSFWSEAVATFAISIGFFSTCFACYRDKSKAMMKAMGTVSSAGAFSLCGCIVVYALHSEIFSIGYSLYLCLAVGPLTAGAWIIHFCARRRNDEPTAGPRHEHRANTAC